MTYSYSPYLIAVNRTTTLLVTLALAASTLAAAAPTIQADTARDAPAAVAAVQVNVNTATAEQLAYLPGVGAVLAERIIAARPLADLAALDAVKGIGPKVLEALKPYVCFAACETTLASKVKPPKATNR